MPPAVGSQYRCRTGAQSEDLILKRQIAAITKALGYDDVHKVGRGDLVALTPEAADITGLPYRPEYKQDERPETGLELLDRKAG